MSALSVSLGTRLPANLSIVITAFSSLSLVYNCYANNSFSYFYPYPYPYPIIFITSYVGAIFPLSLPSLIVLGKLASNISLGVHYVLPLSCEIFYLACCLSSCALSLSCQSPFLSHSLISYLLSAIVHKYHIDVHTEPSGTVQRLLRVVRFWYLAK